jgi:hypothetical protein
MNDNYDNRNVLPLGLASLFRGIYNRVADQLGVGPSYVSRVARGERRSEAVQIALNKEMKRILNPAQSSNGQRSPDKEGSNSRSGTRGASAGRQ